MTLLHCLEMVSLKVATLSCGQGVYITIWCLVETPAGVMVARGILLACSVDLPARAMISNMKQWNGANGCLYCEEEGSTIGTPV